MKILLLSPQPFYQVRGTPIAIDLLVSTLSELGHHVDLVTYHEGDARDYKNVRHFRTPAYRFLNGIQPGFSIKKLLCSALMFCKAISLIRRNQYDLVHANEDAVFMALVYRKVFKLPYVYDMDSSMSGQMTDKMPSLSALFSLAQRVENRAMRHAEGVLAVCEALCKIARPHNDNVQLLTDVSMLDRLNAGSEVVRFNECLPTNTTRFMYIGNLETYQGVDLMLDGFASALSENSAMSLIVIGGTAASIQHYTTKVCELGIEGSVMFAGAKPFSDIGAYMAQADVLLSPRIQGENTPMKIYNYMASGKAIIATHIYSHTQVLTDEYAKLVEVSVDPFARAMIDLASGPEQRGVLGAACKAYADANYSVASFEAVVAAFFDDISVKLK